MTHIFVSMTEYRALLETNERQAAEIFRLKGRLSEIWDLSYSDLTQEGAIARDTLLNGEEKFYPPVCVWSHEIEYESDVWETDCGHALVFDEGTPKESDYKYCPFCRHEITEFEPVNDLEDPDEGGLP